MITVVDNLHTGVETMKLGATDYIARSFDLHRINTSICMVLKNKKRSRGRSDCNIVSCIGCEEGDKQAIDECFNEMNATARGIDAKFDSLDSHSKIVTQRTIELARQLGIAKGGIQKWAATRARLDSERNRAIKSSLNKLRRSPLYQHIMRMTEFMYTHHSSQNPRIEEEKAYDGAYDC